MAGGGAAGAAAAFAFLAGIGAAAQPAKYYDTVSTAFEAQLYKCSPIPVRRKMTDNAQIAAPATHFESRRGHSRRDSPPALRRSRNARYRHVIEARAPAIYSFSGVSAR
ncbi:hypothetical protein EVAR_34541_1 [Eumeta japonica]|uniref:Uncharacterized protein n=1 Tax=Eumeta variegata TaxID=151549 RepID=A0A4C1X857_EUMVA|nr:hypothetical protein EVAR_34541_1 [Eumeta japonica]